MNKPDKRDAGVAEQSILAAAQRVSAFRKARGGPGGKVPLELREEIMKAWHESGIPMDRFAERVGVSGNSIANWSQASSKGSSARPLPKAVKKRGEAFKQVRVVPEANRAEAKPGREFELELLSGARVRGLRMEDLAQLIRIQGGAK